EQLTADFDATTIKVTWVGPPLLFLPVMRPGSPLPLGYMTSGPRPGPGQLPIATISKGSALAPSLGAPPLGAVPQPPPGAASTTNPVTSPLTMPPPTLGTLGQTTTGGTTTTTTQGATTTGAGANPFPPFGTAPGQTGGALGTSMGGVPGMAPGMTGA